MGRKIEFFLSEHTPPPAAERERAEARNEGVESASDMLRQATSKLRQGKRILIGRTPSLNSMAARALRPLSTLSSRLPLPLLPARLPLPLLPPPLRLRAHSTVAARPKRFDWADCRRHEAGREDPAAPRQPAAARGGAVGAEAAREAREAGEAGARVHPSAVVHEGALLGRRVTVGPYCVVGEHVRLADGVYHTSRVPSPCGFNPMGGVVGSRTAWRSTRMPPSLDAEYVFISPNQHSRDAHSAVFRCSPLYSLLSVVCHAAL